jgi:hypothetical protein
MRPGKGALCTGTATHVPSTKVREIPAMLKAIHAGEDIAAAREKAIRVIEKLRGLRLSRATELVEAAVEETLSYYAFPEEHWRGIRTNNPLERTDASVWIFGKLLLRSIGLDAQCAALRKPQLYEGCVNFMRREG